MAPRARGPPEGSRWRNHRNRAHHPIPAAAPRRERERRARVGRHSFPSRALSGNGTRQVVGARWPRWLHHRLMSFEPPARGSRTRHRIEQGRFPRARRPRDQKHPRRAQRRLIKPHDMLPAERVEILKSDGEEAHGYNRGYAFAFNRCSIVLTIPPNPSFFVTRFKSSMICHASSLRPK